MALVTRMDTGDRILRVSCLWKMNVPLHDVERLAMRYMAPSFVMVATGQSYPIIYQVFRMQIQHQ